MSKTLLFTLSLAFAMPLFAQNDAVFCEQVQALHHLVQREHFVPKTLDDSLSTHVFDLFIAEIDADNRLFLKSDIALFSKDKLALDDYIASNSCSFINKYITKLNTRIEDTKSILSALRATDFDYSGKDTLRFKGREKFSNFNSKEDLKRYWSKRIRYDIIYTMIENDSVYEHIEQNFKSLEHDLKDKIISQELCKLEELQHKKGSLEKFVQESFLNAYLLYHDPNSSYFNASDKNVYENRLSNNQLSYGIVTVKNDDGAIVIAHIVPGSAAFKNANIEENDIISALISEEKTLEAYCVSNDDILAFTNDDQINTLTFRLKKPGGIIKDVTLTKEETKSEENTITGYILNSGIKTGYIHISSFYTDFESSNGLGVANDVAKELYKLQKEDIEGLVIDLRFNGGGSMKEAADLSGMFINRGPLSILKYNNGDTFTIKDMNRGSLFTKPIVVLINNFSASASEFFAAAMQDYNRAIIVGSTTHGKASAQVILPLDAKKDLGFTKITVEKFYRITGKSHQSQGVIPDIVLPNMYDNFETEERFSPFALQNDRIPETMRYSKLKDMDFEKLRKKSKLRIQNNERFKAVTQLNKLIIDNYFKHYTSYPLTLENVYNDVQSYYDKWQELDTKMSDQDTGLNAINSAATQHVLSYDPEQSAINDELLKNINSDIYIREANAILKDAIRQLNSSN